ncbi:MAG: ClpXP protease specificity-enhancing factor SspB [Alphaproteobacteria bacterium]|nr:ClpXP protease specificity-enhancing factor SspB [Alphaproteobacteria bacterium]
MAKDLIGYNERARNALLTMLREVLLEVAQKGLQGAHHFYITYDTQAPGVVMSDYLRESHPDDITIVLQNQFEDLAVYDDNFTVRLSFNHRPETLIVPFKAIMRFYDPGVAFGMSFEEFMPNTQNSNTQGPNTQKIANIGQDKLSSNMDDKEKEKTDKAQDKAQNKAKHKTTTQDGVISLDAFRKNKQ